MLIEDLYAYRGSLCLLSGKGEGYELSSIGKERPDPQSIGAPRSTQQRKAGSRKTRPLEG
jgi:hypothetical protein